MTLEELCSDRDWAEVFGDESSGNTDKHTDAIGNCSATPEPTREDVVQILACHEGTADEDAWEGVFLLKDGRYLYAEGSCDYTGWD